MGGEMKKVRIQSEEEDRISTLPDEIIHKIMYYLDSTKLAVQTSILSNRWKLTWKTLPFLKFDSRSYDSYEDQNKFIDHVFSHRNHDSTIHTLDLCEASIPGDVLVKCVKYAILHNVQDLSIYDNVELSILRCCSLKKMKLESDFVYVTLGEKHSWDLPALTTLALTHANDIYDWKFLESCLICLPALTSLSLFAFVLPNSLSLPSLTTLRLKCCELLQPVCYFPALVTLELDDMIFHNNMKDFFSALVSLRNLTLTFRMDSSDTCFISSPQLLNLTIRTKPSYSDTHTPSVNIFILSPKLRNVDSLGIFTITCVASSLDHVNIKLLDCFEDMTEIPLEEVKQYYHQLTVMFPGLGSAKILTLDSETLEALSEVSNLLGHFPSPFYNLKYVKLPHGYKESSLSSTTKRYLLGGSPGATMVTTLPQNGMHTHMVPVPPTPRNVIFEDPLATATNEPVDSLPKKVCCDGNYGLWQSYEVNMEFVDLLDLIMKKYPETFENFTSKSKKLCTMKLNLLCTSVNDFRKTSMNEFSREMITEYRELFADLQGSFNIKWLVSCLNNIEQLHFPNPLLHELLAVDSHIDVAKTKLKDLHTRVDDAKTKLKDLHTRIDDAKCRFKNLLAFRNNAESKLEDLEILHSTMKRAIKVASENMDTLFAGSADLIGDDLFSG